jgi:hypothetical protein
MMALFDNWEMYEESLATSQRSAGTLAKQNEIALDTLDKKLEQLTATTEHFYLTLFDNDAMKNLISGFTTIIDLSAKFVDNLGGVASLLPLALGVGASLMSKKIGAAAGTHSKNKELNRQARE